MIELMEKKIAEQKLPRGASLIPLRGKVPLVNWREYTTRHATTEEMQEWARKFPDHNIGIITGKISGIFVLDVDGQAGMDSLTGYHLPQTPSVKTPHGTHYYFKWIPELEGKVTTKVNIIPNKIDPTKSGGVDVRGEGGLVAFYGWQRGLHLVPLYAPPQWLIDLLPNKVGAKTIESGFKKLDYSETLKNLKVGEHSHDAIYRLAGGLRARGFEPQEIYDILSPKAREVGFNDKDLRTTCQRVSRYPAGPRPPDAEIIVPDSFEAFLSDEKRVEYIVPGVFAAHSIAFVAGLPETCKTWTLVDLAVELARKGNGLWLGQYPVKHAKVVYIDQERDKSETQRRFKALVSAKNIPWSELNDSLVVKCGTTIRLNLQNSFNSFRQFLTDTKPDIVLIDSYKTFHTYDINSNVQMQEIMEKLKELRNTIGCTFVFIFHENKGAHERVDANGKKKQISFDHMAGAAVMSEVAETILITVKQDADSSFLHHVKNTYGQKVAPVLVNIENVTPDKSQIRVIAR